MNGATPTRDKKLQEISLRKEAAAFSGKDITVADINYVKDMAEKRDGWWNVNVFNHNTTFKIVSKWRDEVVVTLTYPEKTGKWTALEVGRWIDNKWIRVTIDKTAAKELVDAVESLYQKMLEKDLIVHKMTDDDWNWLLGAGRFAQ